jgi:hypothetical protein
MNRITGAIAAAVISLSLGLGTMASSAMASPAQRTTIHVLNETSGSFAMRDANDSGSTGNPIVEGAKGVFGSATDFQWQDLGTQSNYNGVTRENGEIFLLQHANRCLGSSTGGFITTQACDTGTGTIVAEVFVNGAPKFESRLYSDSLNGNQFVTGSGNSGQLSFESDGNGFQRWTPATGQG